VAVKAPRERTTAGAATLTEAIRCCGRHLPGLDELVAVQHANPQTDRVGDPE